jgi:hypothetical protein
VHVDENFKKGTAGRNVFLVHPPHRGKSYLEAADCVLFLIVMLHVTNFISYFVPQIWSDNFQSRDLVFPLRTLMGGAENIDALQCLLDGLEGVSFDATSVHQEYPKAIVKVNKLLPYILHLEICVGIKICSMIVAQGLLRLPYAPCYS